MHYTETVLLITNSLFSVLGVLLAHFIVFALIGVFKKKTYPKTQEKLRYGIIVPARNEEAVIRPMIESIQKNAYPQENLQVFVIAHNCTDRTAELARAAGATVYEYDNPNENTMGYAFRHLFSKIEADCGTQTFDGFFIFNADNLLDKNFISRMNDAFLACEKKCVITSFRHSKNFGKNLISGLYGLYFAVGCLLDSRGRTAAGCSTRVQGTGYLLPAEAVQDGWNYVSLTEDWEFTADWVLRGGYVRYCDEAVFYDEQPTSIRIMWRQRVRWARGHLDVFFSRIRALLKGLFSKKTANRISVYDITAYLLPVVTAYAVLTVAQILLLLIAPLIEPTRTLREIFIGASLNPLLSDGLLPGMVRGWLFSYCTTAISGVLIFLLDRKRIRNLPLLRKISLVLLWPLFLAIQVPIEIQAIFSKNLSWKPIPHSDQTSFEDVNV